MIRPITETTISSASTRGLSSLSKILGHSSVAVTAQHYAHLLKEDLVAASQQVKIPVAPRGTGNVVRLPRRRSGTSR
jgi:hypothetical protein